MLSPKLRKANTIGSSWTDPYQPHQGSKSPPALAPPMRISIDQKDSGYANWLLYDVDEITLDGVIQDKAITADEEEGLVVRHMQTENGLYMIKSDNTGTEKEVVKGVVKVKRTRRPKPLPA